jgi:hypothetical protein
MAAGELLKAALHELLPVLGASDDSLGDLLNIICIAASANNVIASGPRVPRAPRSCNVGVTLWLFRILWRHRMTSIASSVNGHETGGITWPFATYMFLASRGHVFMKIVGQCGNISMYTPGWWCWRALKLRFTEPYNASKSAFGCNLAASPSRMSATTAAILCGVFSRRMDQAELAQ